MGIKQILKWLSFGLSCYLFFLFITMPVAKVVGFLPESVPVQMKGVSGTVGKGRASSITLPAGHLSNVSWDTSLLWMIIGQTVSDLQFGSKGELRGNGRFSGGILGNSVSDLWLSMPASMVLDKVKLPLPLQASGDLDLEMKYASAGTPLCGELDGVLTWPGGELMTPAGKLTLEQFKAQLSCDEGEVVINFSEDSQQLSLELTMRVMADKAYRLKGWVKPGAQMPKMMADNLGFIGERDGEGRLRVDLKDTF